MRSLLCAALLAAAAPAAHAQLDATEQRIVASVKQDNPAALQLLERSVRINSGTLNPEGVREVDLNFVAPIVTGIDGLGAHGTGSHTDSEDLEIASIERGTIRAAILLYRLTR